MKVTVIYNPAAGGGREALLYRLVAELERLGATVCQYHTKGPHDATDYLKGLATRAIAWWPWAAMVPPMKCSMG
jgi:diacylglycerol kinase family enzyme